MTKRTEEKKWVLVRRGKGVMDYRLSSWRSFSELVQDEGDDGFHKAATGYIFRGQANAKWDLESSLDRLLRKCGKLEARWPRSSHLEHFKKAALGRRGSNPPWLDEDNWWALGQHHGLATPLLDWTHSPFVALYFAFADQN